MTLIIQLKQWGVEKIKHVPFNGVAHGQRIPNNNDDDDEEEVNAIIINRSNGPTMHARDHNIIPAPRMGTKSVNSKLLKHYGEMTDGGRAYDKACLLYTSPSPRD